MFTYVHLAMSPSAPLGPWASGEWRKTVVSLIFCPIWDTPQFHLPIDPPNNPKNEDFGLKHSVSGDLESLEGLGMIMNAWPVLGMHPRVLTRRYSECSVA